MASLHAPQCAPLFDAFGALIAFIPVLNSALTRDAEERAPGDGVFAPAPGAALPDFSKSFPEFSAEVSK